VRETVFHLIIVLATESKKVGVLHKKRAGFAFTKMKAEAWGSEEEKTKTSSVGRTQFVRDEDREED